MLIDESAVVRARLVALIDEVGGFRVVAEHASAVAAIDRLRQPGAPAPGLVVVAVELNVGNGLDVLRFVRSNVPATRVFVFSQHDDPAYRERYTEAGADAFFSKISETQRLRAVLSQLVASDPGNGG